MGWISGKIGQCEHSVETGGVGHAGNKNPTQWKIGNEWSYKWIEKQQPNEIQTTNEVVSELKKRHLIY